jgi:hypothetical protein
MSFRTTQPRVFRLIAFPLAFAFTALLPAQDYRAKVQGTVKDSSGATIAGSQVTLSNVNTGISGKKTTNDEGQYIFDFVEPGTYTLTAEHTGFSKFLQENFTVQVRADITVDPVLNVGGLAEQVTVSDTVVGVKFNTSGIDLTIDRKMLTDLPILGRNPFRLALLDPSVVDRGWGANNPFDMWGAATIDVGGGTNGKIDLLLDGAPLGMTNKASYAPPMDAVQEFTVQTNSVDAEFGNSAGGTMSLSMAAGTNEFHGTAYYFGRNPKLNAVSDAISRTPNFVRNHIWGGTLGNPVVKNKLFTFTSWEQWRTKDPRLNIRTMPTDLERIGDFSQSRNAEGGLRTIYDPWTTTLDGAGNVVRVPFAGNVIPRDRLDPTALRIMEDIWQPNNPGDDITRVNNFKESYTWMSRYWNFSNRTDFNINEKWKVFGRYSQFRNLIDESHTVDTRAMPKDEGGAMYALNIAGDAVYVMSPSTVLNFTGSYGSIQDDYFSESAAVTEEDLAGLWPNRWFSPYTKDLPAIYYPGVNVGDASFGHRFFWIEHPKNASVQGKLVHTQGRHNLKTGLVYRRNFGLINYPDPMTFNFGAALTADTFLNPDTSLSGDPYATFLLGALDANSQAQYISPHELRVNSYGAFIHDDFKLNPRITLNLGLRYEYETAPTDRLNRISQTLDLNNPVPEMQGANAPQIPAEVTAIANIPYQWNGAWSFASEDNPGMFRTSKRSFMPRVGVAIRLTDGSSLRAGYARFVIPVSQTQPFQTTAIRLYGFTARSLVAPPLTGVPQATLSDPFPASNPLVLPTGTSLGRYQNLGDTADFPAQNLETGVRERMNVSFQQQLPGKFVGDVTYFLNLGYNLPYSRVLNQMDPQIGYTHKTALARTVPNPFFQYLTPELFPGQLRNRPSVSVGSLLNPYPHYGTLRQTLTPGVNNRYQSVQFRLQRPFTNGLSLLWAYNYNREQNYEFFNADDQFVDRFTYIDGFLPRHRMNIAGSYDLPFGKGRPHLSAIHPVLNGVLGGWSMSGIFNYNSGQFVRFGGAVVEGDPAIDNPTRDAYWDTSKFKGPLPAFTPRTNPWQYPGVTGPRFTNIDATLSKFFPIAERIRLEFKMEAYNLTNSFMASMPNATVTSSLFGRSTAQANRGRELQYTLRLHF